MVQETAIIMEDLNMHDRNILHMLFSVKHWNDNNFANIFQQTRKRESSKNFRNLKKTISASLNQLFRNQKARSMNKPPEH